MKRIILVGLLGMAGWAAETRAATFHVATAQDLQNALTLAASDGAPDTIYLAAGYYTGNFNYNSSEAFDLTIQGEPGTDPTQITIDGAGVGRSLVLSCSALANITIQGITVLRNCGNSGNGALRIATAADILVSGCQFLSPTNASGGGIEIAQAGNVSIMNCTVTGNNQNSGGGVSISGEVDPILWTTKCRN